MRIVFMGTPEFAVPSLKAVAAAYDVALVVTRPDAVRSRGKKLEPSPVKACALELGLPVLEAKRMDPAAIEAVRAAAPDLICVVAFGCILPDELLAVAPLGAINVHGSLLPRWRGAAPIQRAILAGDEKTGISIMRVAHDLDAGAWCRQVATPIGTKTAGQLFDELAHAGAPSLSPRRHRLPTALLPGTSRIPPRSRLPKRSGRTRCASTRQTRARQTRFACRPRLTRHLRAVRLRVGACALCGRQLWMQMRRRWRPVPLCLPTVVCFSAAPTERLSFSA
jgi:methionyl-tRNA formyltransferase